MNSPAFLKRRRSCCEEPTKYLIAYTLTVLSRMPPQVPFIVHSDHSELNFVGSEVVGGAVTSVLFVRVESSDVHLVDLAQLALYLTGGEEVES